MLRNEQLASLSKSGHLSSMLGMAAGSCDTEDPIGSLMEADVICALRMHFALAEDRDPNIEPKSWDENIMNCVKSLRQCMEASNDARETQLASWISILVADLEAVVTRSDLDNFIQRMSAMLSYRAQVRMVEQLKALPMLKVSQAWKAGKPWMEVLALGDDVGEDQVADIIGKIKDMLMPRAVVGSAADISPLLLMELQGLLNSVTVHSFTVGPNVD